MSAIEFNEWDAINIMVRSGLPVASAVGEYAAKFPITGNAGYYDGTTLFVPRDSSVEELRHELGHWCEAHESGTTGLVNYGLDALLEDGYNFLAGDREVRATALEPWGDEFLAKGTLIMDIMEAERDEQMTDPTLIAQLHSYVDAVFD